MGSLWQQIGLLVVDGWYHRLKLLQRHMGVMVSKITINATICSTASLDWKTHQRSGGFRSQAGSNAEDVSYS